MKQALKVVNEINRMQLAIKKTDSKYLKRDYKKSIKENKEQLKFYCKCKGIKYKELEKKMNAVL